MTPSNDCGCCAGRDAETPVRIDNRPGLPAIAYRVGTHARFKELMLARISSTEFPALAGLTTREDGDFTIAFCDATAMVLDVLTFYQERIANEAYLRTALERRSVLELARLIGFELAPGVAASTYLAFTLQEAPGAPEQAARPVSIPIGTRVQSVPGPDEQPQSFETVEAVEGRPGWNAMAVQTTTAQVLKPGETELILAGVNHQLQPGDTFLFVGAEREQVPASEHWDLRGLQTVETDANKDLTHVTWRDGLTHVDASNGSSVKVFVFRQRAALFGHNAPDPNLLATRGTNLRQLIDQVSTPWTWENFLLDLGQHKRVDLDASYPKIIPGSWFVLWDNVVGPASPVPIELPSGEISIVFKPGGTAQRLLRVEETIELSRADFALSLRVTRLAPDHVPAPREFDPRETLVLAQSEELPLAERPLGYPLYGSEVRLDHHVEGLVPTQGLAVTGKRQRLRIAQGAKDLALLLDEGGTVALAAGDSLILAEAPVQVIVVTVLSVISAPTFPQFTIVTPVLPGSSGSPGDGGQPFPTLTFTAPDSPTPAAPFDLSSNVGTSPPTAIGSLTLTGGPPTPPTRVIFAALKPPEFGRILAEVPTATLRLRLVDRDGRLGMLTTEARYVRLDATRKSDETVTELAFVGDREDAVGLDRDRTILMLADALKHCYDRDTVRFNANVAPATHGESVSEILGSGDASAGNQSFSLRQSPLTFVSAATADGRASTLEVRVNDLLWEPAPSLYGHGPEERVYRIAIDDEARATVVLGDGIEGARLPSGQDNSRASYRKGIGTGGNLLAGQISNLLTRPLGVTGASNPEPSSGGEDPESLADARDNAPLTVLTLDRAVSIRDYEDYARSFAGIAKAHALWIPSGLARGVFLTVAGIDGAAVKEASDTYHNLLASLRRYGDPLVPLTLRSYRAIPFRIEASIKVAEDAEVDKVLASVEEELRACFGFRSRSFGQPVSVDEVAAAIHGVAGVVAVDIDRLNPIGTAANLRPRLFARLPLAMPQGEPAPAELLVLDAGPIGLGVIV